MKAVNEYWPRAWEGCLSDEGGFKTDVNTRCVKMLLNALDISFLKYKKMIGK